jgi:hypothetical protein
MKRRTLSVILLIVSLGLVLCKKDDGVSPKNTQPVRNVKSFKIVGYNIITQMPSLVNLMFQVTDMSGMGVEFLTADRFQLLENGDVVDPVATSLLIRKPEDINYNLHTILLLDVSSSANLSEVKSAAAAMINGMVDRQSFSIYTYSDKLNEVIVQSQDKTALTEALNSITANGDVINLYGALHQLLNGNDERYEVDNVQQVAFVVIAGSKDNKAEKTIMQVVKLAEVKRVYTIGIGSDLDTEALDALGTASYTKISSISQLTKTLMDIQEELKYWSQSFYWMSYATTVRKDGSNELKLAVTENQYANEGSIWDVYYTSSGFFDAIKGVFINWVDGQTIGIDVLYVILGDTSDVTATTLKGTKPPKYTWSIDNPAIAQIVPIPGTTNKIKLIATGNDGDEATLTVIDTGNDITETVKVKVSTYIFGKLLREWWSSISGTAITDLTKNKNFPSNPTGREEITSFECPVNFGDNYGQRVRGFVHPPTTGEYNFRIASDDLSELWLSTDTDPANKVKICYVATWTNSREWSKETNQKSNAIQLEAGKAYYIEALMKEGTGGDNLAVAWTGPGISPPVVLTGNCISLWLVN